MSGEELFEAIEADTADKVVRALLDLGVIWKIQQKVKNINGENNMKKTSKHHRKK